MILFFENFKLQNLFFKFWRILVLGLALSCPVMAAPLGAPLVGDNYSQFIPTEMGYQIPLPPGKWEVTAIRIRQEPKINNNTTKHVVLKSRDSGTVFPYMVVRYATIIHGSNWAGNCDSIEKNMFDSSMYGTSKNQTYQKCQKIWSSTLPNPTWSEWWNDLHKGFDSADLNLKKELLTHSFFNLSKWGGDFVYINLFARPSLSGTTAGKLEAAARNGEVTPWMSAFKAWSEDYMRALETSVFNKKPVAVAAFTVPGMGLTMPPVVTASVEPTSVGRTAPNNNAPLLDTAQLAAEARAKEELRLAEEKRLKAEQDLGKEQLRLAEVERRNMEMKAREQALENQRLIAEVARLQAEAEKNRIKSEPMANRKALVIGNNKYKFVSPLATAAEDAKTIADNLAQVGYKVTLKLDASEREMRAAIRNFSSQVEGGDEVAFYFAGHGVQIGSANYLIPVDVNGESEAQIRDEAIALQRILDEMTERKAKFTLAVIDACRDNPFKVAGRNLGSALRGLAPTSAATGQMVIFSAGAGQKALDSLGPSDKSKNGVFTRVFVKQMQKPAVPIDKILKDTRSEVVNLAKTIGHEQVPAIYDQVIGEFFFKK